MQDLATLHTKVSEILDDIHPIFIEGLSKSNNIIHKTDINAWADIVTEYDTRIENILVEKLHASFPDFGFITEEKSDREIKEWNWIIDPIDGTLNYSRGIQTCGTSIALWKGDTPVYGILAFPALNERLHVIKGEGIYLNDKKIEHKEKDMPKMPYIAMSLLSYKGRKMTTKQIIANELGSAPLTFGATSYHLYLTASGKADMTCIVNNAIWDIATAELFANEAKLGYDYVWDDLKVSTLNRKYEMSVVIGPKKGVEKISKVLRETFNHGRDLLVKKQT